MLRSRNYWLSSPTLLNDKHEFKQFPDNTKEAESMFLASFVGLEEESMAMWSMYGKKWEHAVKIAFRIDLFEHAMLNNDKYYIENNNLTNRVIDSTDYFTSIAYIRDIKKNRALHCGTVANTKVLKEQRGLLPIQLVGFVKDTVWSYEKEVRFIVKTKPENRNKKFTKISVDLTSDSTNELWETIEITPSPCFAGNLEKKLVSAGLKNYTVKNNKFKDDINITSSCKCYENKENCYDKY